MQKKHSRFFPALLCFPALFIALSAAHAAPPADFTGLVKASVPAVVNVHAERTEQMRPFNNPFEMFRGHPDLDPFFSPFEDFHNRAPRSRKSQSLGSGFLISADGFIVTNNHVIDGAEAIKVNVGSSPEEEKSFPAVLIGSDPETDLALLKIDASGLPFLELGDSDALEVGEWVVAIGSPLGLNRTVTAGIVSAKGRNIQSGSYDDYLQTDASINQGNSGGPLLSMDGKVVGINTAIARRAQGIGFAIPSNLAQNIIDNLKQHKKVSRGWLGVTIQNVDDAMAKALGMENNKGALINSVLDNQPAARAGLKDGDVILSVNGREIPNTEQLLRVIAGIRPGEAASVIVWRDGERKTFSLTVAERDLSATQADGGAKAPEELAPLGLKMRPVTADDARRNRIKVDSGLLVTAVERDSEAAEIGVRAGDILVSIDRAPVKTVEEAAQKIADAKKQRGAVLLQVLRNGQMFFQAIDLGKS